MSAVAALGKDVKGPLLPSLSNAGPAYITSEWVDRAMEGWEVLFVVYFIFT